MPTPGDTKWFVHDRFGMFIHWGLYAMAARHEWVRHNEEIPNETYDSKYFARFNPDLYNPCEWAKAAANAGMKYFVITTKHHEGFCLWDSEYTDYKAPNTPVKKDLLKPMVEAFRGHGLKVGFYHSLIDWHHPQFIIDKHIGPYRNKDREALNKGRKQEKYAEYLHNQVRELLTKFGKVDILWLDFSYPNPEGTGKGKNDWQSEKLYKMVRELQPKIVLNDRLDLDYGFDIKTPEQVQPRSWVTFNGQPVVWEACQTFSGSWGYHRDESTWKSVDMLIWMLIDAVSKGGNLLLNVGPTARGEFDKRALDRLSGIGEWMKRHYRSIYGCTQAPEEFDSPKDCRLTYNSETKRLYVHLLNWPFGGLFMDRVAGKVEYAQLLNDGSEIKFEPYKVPDWQKDKGNKETLLFHLPVVRPEVTVPVIELFIK